MPNRYRLSIRRVAVALAAAVASGLCGASAARCETAPDPGELRPYIGKLPFSGVDGRSLFNVPRLRSRLVDLVGRSGVAAMENWNVTSEITEHDGWLIAHGCRPHWCNSENFVLAVNLADYRVDVCLAPKNGPVRLAATGRKPAQRPHDSECPLRDPVEAVAFFREAFPD